VRINQEIRTPTVRLIDHNGENRGVIPIENALQIAREANLDLIEIAPEATPPVCKILDLGKFMFEKNKKERLARKSQTKIEVKEIQMRPKTNVHHRNLKVNAAKKWLEKGMKVRATVRFRGREASYPELALEDLREVAEMLKDHASIEVPPAVEGRNMSMVLIPIKGIKKPAAESKKVEAVAPAEGEKKPVKEKIEKKTVESPAPAANVKKPSRGKSEKKAVKTSAPQEPTTE
jgi:translation initiation factor IF-3